MRSGLTGEWKDGQYGNIAVSTQQLGGWAEIKWGWAKFLLQLWLEDCAQGFGVGRQEAADTGLIFACDLRSILQKSLAPNHTPSDAAGHGQCDRKCQFLTFICSYAIFANRNGLFLLSDRDGNSFPPLPHPSPPAEMNNIICGGYFLDKLNVNKAVFCQHNGSFRYASCLSFCSALLWGLRSRWNCKKVHNDAEVKEECIKAVLLVMSQCLACVGDFKLPPPGKKQKNQATSFVVDCS